MNNANTTPTVILDREKYLIAALIARASSGINRSRDAAVGLARDQYVTLDDNKAAHVYLQYEGNQIKIERWGVDLGQLAEGKQPEYCDIMLDVSVVDSYPGAPSIPQARFLGVYCAITYYLQHLGSTGHYNIIAINADDNKIDVVMLSDASKLEEFQAGLQTRYDGSEHAFAMAQAFIYNFYSAE